MKIRWGVFVAVVCGAAIWIFAPMMTGRAEPWDARSPYYWVSLLVSGFIVGCVEPKRSLTSSLWIVAGQTLAIPSNVLFGGKDIGLFIPMGLIALLILSAPCYVGAFVGSRVALVLPKKMRGSLDEPGV